MVLGGIRTRLAQHKVDESNLRSMGLSEIKRGSRNAAKKIQAAYDELLHVTNTNEYVCCSDRRDCSA